MERIITPTDSQWAAFVAAQPRAHVLQQPEWGTLKAAYGWGVERIAMADGDQIVAGAQLLFRALPFHLGTMAYLPMGGFVTRDDLWQPLWNAVDACAKRHHAAFLKWEPGFYWHEQPPDFARFGFQSSPQTVQPPNTILIDITGSEDAILARMNQGTRRKIRQSQKNDVRYYEGTRADVAKFNGMMQTTGSRNAFGVHAPDYYELAYDLFVKRNEVEPHAALILAEHEGDSLAGIMVFALGKTAWYLYGASSNEKRNLMAAYGVQWKAIQWAKARGCTVYDLWGIPDADETTLEAQFETRSDGLWGVYGFKRGWGGEVVRSAGAWDKIYNPFIYKLYQLALRYRGASE